MVKNNLNEATTKYIKKIVDPALLTWDEYYKIANPEDKFHSNDIYQTDYQSNAADKDAIKRYPILINNIKLNNVPFQVRKAKDKLSYSARDEKGEILRDERGISISLTKDEIKKLGLRLYSEDVGIFDEDSVKVASASDEWGALLVQVVKEYRDWGLGKIALTEYLKIYPKKEAGGFTEGGYNNRKSYYFDRVRDYLQSGLYSHLIKNGNISMEKVKKIISQLPERKKREEKDYNFYNPKDFLVMDLDGEFIIYNKRIIPILMKDRDMGDFFANKGIMGHIRPLYMEHLNSYRLQLFYAKNTKIANLLNMFLASYLYDEKTAIITNDQHKMFETYINPTYYKVNKNSARSKKHIIDYKIFGVLEKKARNEICGNRVESEEIRDLIMEMTYGLSED